MSLPRAVKTPLLGREARLSTHQGLALQVQAGPGHEQP